jgi:hypothetical protein
MHMQPETQGGALPKTNAQEEYAVAINDNNSAADGNQRCAAPVGNHTICPLRDTFQPYAGSLLLATNPSKRH